MAFFLRVNCRRIFPITVNVKVLVVESCWWIVPFSHLDGAGVVGDVDDVARGAMVALTALALAGVDAGTSPRAEPLPFGSQRAPPGLGGGTGGGKGKGGSGREGRGRGHGAGRRCRRRRRA